MNILHTESSNGWGGQEIRILKEALGFRNRNHHLVFAVVSGGRLVEYAREHNFVVYEVSFFRYSFLLALKQLVRIIKKHQIHLVNTHSSLDAWLGGIAARLTRCKVVRTRHLSTPIKGGINAFFLYKKLTDFVVTTSTGVISHLAQQAKLPSSHFASVPTGVEPFQVREEEKKKFRDQLAAGKHDILVGTLCVVRSWKGIQDLIKAAQLLRGYPHIKWVIIGGGYLAHFQHLVDASTPVTFVGHLEMPFAAVAALDIFLLLSTAHEGVSQASLQAAFLHKPLITTTVGGLPEVCEEGVTGLLVPPSSPERVAEAVLRLACDEQRREKYGRAAHQLVQEKFTFQQTVDRMEEIFFRLLSQKNRRHRHRSIEI